MKDALGRCVGTFRDLTHSRRFSLREIILSRDANVAESEALKQFAATAPNADLLRAFGPNIPAEGDDDDAGDDDENDDGDDGDDAPLVVRTTLVAEAWMKTLSSLTMSFRAPGGKSFSSFSSSFVGAVQRLAQGDMDAAPTGPIGFAGQHAAHGTVQNAPSFAPAIAAEATPIAHATARAYAARAPSDESSEGGSP